MTKRVPYFLGPLQTYFHKAELPILSLGDFLSANDRKIIYSHQNTALEVGWTILPTAFLIIVSVPSLMLIYLTTPYHHDPFGFLVRVVGSQWFWTYETNDIVRGRKLWSIEDWYLFQQRVLQGVDRCDGSFPWEDDPYRMIYDTDMWGYWPNHKPGKTNIIESHLIPDKDLLLGEFRLLDVDERLLLPKDVKVTFLITATDVLHSWSVPSFGIKVDACPGRVNVIDTKIYRCSIFYGQCSEICGVLHGFMPIVVEVVTLTTFFNNTVSNK